MYRTDDPEADFLRYDADRAREEAKLPHCDYCDEPLYESYYHIYGEILCTECMEKQYKRDVESDFD